MAPSKFLTKNNLIRALPLLTSAAGRTDRWGHTRPGPGRKTKDGFMSKFWGGKKNNARRIVFHPRRDPGPLNSLGIFKFIFKIVVP